LWRAVSQRTVWRVSRPARDDLPQSARVVGDDAPCSGLQVPFHRAAAVQCPDINEARAAATSVEIGGPNAFPEGPCQTSRNACAERASLAGQVAARFQFGGAHDHSL